MNAAATELQALVNRGAIKGERNIEFAVSLLRAANRKRGPTPEQAKWIGKLVARANNPEPVPVAVQLGGDVVGVFTLFETATTRGLKWPKIRLQAVDGTPVVFSRAGERSRYPGAVMVTDGGPFGANRFFGRVDAAGQMVEGRAMTDAVRVLVQRFAIDPAGVAAAYGKTTGACCFCSRSLDTVESVAVGYGPVCAKKFNLPWGKSAPGDKHVCGLTAAECAVLHKRSGDSTPDLGERAEQAERDMQRIEAEAERASETAGMWSDPDYDRRAARR